MKNRNASTTNHHKPLQTLTNKQFATVRVRSCSFVVLVLCSTIVLAGMVFGLPQAANGQTSAIERAVEDDPYADPFEGTSVVIEKKEALRDPMAKWNRGVFTFNDFIYFNLLRPAAKGYKSIIPKFIRRAVRNFFMNLQEPVYLINSILQKKPDDARLAISRFLVNSTAGVGGLGRPMKDRPESSKRTFDQTFAKWGVAPGVYVVWPFIGPSTFLRGTLGWGFEEAMDATNYAGAGVGAASSVLETTNETSFQLGAYEDFKKYAVDPYASLKDIYEKRIQKRAKE